MIAYPVKKLRPNPGALPLWHNNKTRCPVSARLKFWADGKVRNRLAVHKTDEVFGGGGLRQLQIIMRLKEMPVTGIDLPNFQFDSWAFVRAAALAFFISWPLEVSNTQSGSSQSRMS